MSQVRRKTTGQSSISLRTALLFAGGIGLAGGLPLAAQTGGQTGTPPPPAAGSAAQVARPCHAHGRIASGDDALPGAAVTARLGDKVVAITSSDADGMYSVPLAPGTYQIRAELTAFAPVDKDVTVGQPPCDVEADLKLQLASRAPATPGQAAMQVIPSQTVFAPQNAQNRGQGRGGAQGQAAGQAGQANQGAAGQGGGGRGGRQGGGFQALTVNQAAGSAAAGADTVLDVSGAGAGAIRADDPAARLLPAGFSTDAALESVAVAGSMVQIDPNLLNERLQALGRGEFGLAEGQFGQPGQGIGGLGGALGGDAGGRAGGDGGFGGGGGGRGGGLAGRIGGANRMQVSANYGLGSSLLDSAPYPLRSQSNPKRDYTNQNFSTTLGGPVVIPGLYNGATRTTFNFSYTGSRNGGVYDQYATVPTMAQRTGDFSGSSVLMINPATGEPFANNQVPVSAAAAALLRFIPAPTFDGTTRNFRRTTPTMSTNDSFSLRITHSITKPPAGRGGRGGAAGGRGGGQPANGAAPAASRPTATPAAGTTGTGTAATTTTAGATTAANGTATTPPATGTTTTRTAGSATPGTGATASAPGVGRGNAQGRGGAQGAGGRGGRGNFQPQLNVTMNATINYRRNDGDRLNVFSALDGTTHGSTLSVPVSVNMRYGRSVHNFSATFNRTQSTSLNGFAFNSNIVGALGIAGVSTEPFDWGVPTISFGSSGFTGIRDVAPSQRTDKSFQFGYTWTRPAGRHNWRLGGNFQQTWNDTQSDSNARGSFTFTGVYTADGLTTTRGSGQDFADFLLGLPQQATRSFSINPNNIVTPILVRGRNFNVSISDDFRWKARWTVNYGLNYAVVFPFTEANGHMVNLDVNSDFTAVAPVESGQTGLFSGLFPVGLVKTDWNNLSPSVGVAWRNTNKSVIRFGYGLSYNSGTYSGIARNLYQQPPFFQTGTVIGSADDPISILNAFSNIAAGTVVNTYGIDPNYVAGLIHQYSVDYGRSLFRAWSVGATYFGTLGRDLDLLRAPNRGPTGLRIDGVQSFTYQTSQGSSHANGVTFRLQKQQTHGVAGTVTYTLSKSMDNTTATGGGVTVAQDDQNLAAEWALSNFDQRHAISGNLTVQLPWGPNRKWLADGGLLATIAGGWSMSANFSWNTGTPLTIRCSSCASDVARGVGGTLRADYNGQPITVANPTIDEFFNILAFSVPQPGTFGNSLRNVVIGPNQHQLNANFTRDVRLGGNRVVSLQVTANNLLNTVNWGGINTDVNAPTDLFGQVTSVRGMRTVRFNMRFRF